MKRARLNLEALEDRVVPATVDSYWHGDGSSQARWNVASNWTDRAIGGTTLTSYPGSVGDRTDIVHLETASASRCVLDVTLISTGISELRDTAGNTLILQKGLLVTNGGRLDGRSMIYNGSSGSDNGLSLTGGTFTWHSGNLGYLSDLTFNPATLNVDGATLKVDNTEDVVLGFGINVGTGSAQSTMELANTGAIKDYGYDPLSHGEKAPRQIVVGIAGTLNITVDNTSGIVPVDPNNVVYAVFTNVGTVTKSGGTAGGYYSIREPWYQTGGSLTINPGNALRFYGKTGLDESSDGTRGKSFFMDGGTVNLKADPTMASPTLWVQYGYQQDYGGTLNCSSTNVTTACTWVIDATASATNKIRLNGSDTKVGSLAGDFGALSLLTGGGANNTGLYWQAGALKVEDHLNADGTYTVSKLVTDAKVSISDTGNTSFKVLFAGDQLLSGTYLIIDTGFAITHAYDPTPGDWTGTFNSGYQITYTGHPPGG